MKNDSDLSNYSIIDKKYSIIGKIKKSNSSYLSISKFNNKYRFLKIYKDIFNSNEESFYLFRNISILKALHKPITKIRFSTPNKTKITNLRSNSIVSKSKDLIPNNFNLIEVYDIQQNRKNEKDLIVAYEFINCSLRSFLKIRNDKNLNEYNEIKEFICYQLICIVESLHNLKVINLNLNPNNILINNDSIIKLSDLSFSIKDGDESSMREYNSVRYYKSPELLLNVKKIHKQSDIWSLGCIFYEIYFNQILFDCNSTIDHFIRIIEFNENNISNSDIKSIPLAEGYINSILNFYDKRPSIIFPNEGNQDNQSTNKFSQNVVNIIKRMLEFNPNKRISIFELKQNFSQKIRNIYRNLVDQNRESDNYLSSNNLNPNQIQEKFWKEIIIDIEKHNKIVAFKELKFNKIYNIY